MARTITGSIVTAELSGSLKPTTALTSTNELLSFALFTAQTNVLLDTSVSQTYAPSHVTWRTTDGKAWTSTFDPSTVGQWALSTSGATQIDGTGASTQYHAMRYGIDSGIVFVPNHTSSIQLFKIGVGNYGPAFGPAFANTSSKVVRVEAVCPNGAGVIVAVGSHDFTLKLSTIQFWYVTTGAAVQLDTIIQATLSDTYTNWYSCAKWASFVSAIYDTSTLTIRVVANAHPSGKAVTFSIRNGVESMLRSVVAVDPAYGTITFRASSVTQIGTLFYLCGRLTYTFADGTIQAFDCYLTSSDGDAWSVGERSFYLHASDSMGALLLDTVPTPNVIYYGGNLIVSVANGTPAQGVNTASMQTSLEMLPGGALSQVSNAAHTLTFNIANSDGSYSDNPIVTRGSVLRLSKGQWGVTSPVGAYSIDSVGSTVSNAGRQASKIVARDIASKAIIRHNAPVDAEFNGQGVLVTTLADATGLIVKTRTADILTLASTPSAPNPADYDATFGILGLQHKGLNNPLVALADVQDAPDVLLKATVTFPDTGDTGALSSFAFLFNAEDDGTFRGVIVPKVNTWPAAGKTKPRVVASNIRPYDTALNTGGFNFPARLQALWSSNNVGSDAYAQAMSEIASHYTTEAAYTHTIGTTRDYVCRVSGRRVQLFSKLHDYAAATMAANAVFTLHSEYLYSDDARLIPAGKARPGFAVTTDTWALQTAFDHAAYAEQEVGLTGATDYSSNRSYYNTQGTGTIVEENGTPDSTAITGTGTLFTTQFRVGQVVGMSDGGTTNHVRTITAIDTNTYMHATGISNFSRVVGGWIYCKSGDNWGQASSASGLATVGTGTIWLDPKPIKVVKTMTGMGAFVTNDQTAYDQGWFDSDGVTHYRLDKGWDATWPGAYGEPGSWKFLLHHNSIGKFRASVDYGLAAAGRMLVEHEIVRYGEIQIQLWKENLSNTAYQNYLWLTYIPTWYAIPQSQGAASQTVYNNMINAADDLNNITSPAGLLCEITGRSAGGVGAVVPNVYLTAKGGGAGVRGWITIDTLPAGPVLNSDLLIVSGRGQLGTKKTTHASDAPVCYYPVSISATTAPASFVTVSRFEAYTGVRRSVEDALKYLCNLAGARGATFRNVLDTAYVKTPYVYVITATPTAIPTVGAKTFADFVLDMDVHIDVTNRLYIDFRNYYRLTLKQVGAGGAIEVGLQAPNDATITASGGFRWLQYASVNVNAGLTLCATAADNAHVRISVIDGNIAIEINGKHLWTFSLDEFVADDGTSYKKLTSGSILLSFASAVAGNSASIRLLELWAEHTALALPMGTNTANTIRRICDRWKIRSRATQSEGLEFSTFTSRDAAGTLQKSLASHSHTGDDSKSVGHIMVTGKQSGAFLNASHIAANGYSFQTSANSDANTAQESAEAGQIIARESVEFATQEQVIATARIADEVEDKVTLVYSPGDDAPSFASAAFVITAINTNYGLMKDESNYALRKYQAWS